MNSIMSIRNAILKKKIENTVYDLMIKTTASMVFESADGSLTLADYLANQEGGILFDAKAYADSKSSEILGSATDGSAANTIYGAKAYAEAVASSVAADLAAAFKFKGTVNYVADLPDGTEGHERAAGDVYQVLYRGTEGTDDLNAEYAYTTEKGWVELGSIIDLRAYAQIGSATDSSAADTIFGAKAFASAVAAAVLGTVGDGSAANTVYGAKAYASALADAVVGSNTDGSNANTVYGAKAFASAVASSAVADVIGSTTDASTADTINGAKAFASAVAGDVLGTATDGSNANTVYGAKAYASARADALGTVYASTTQPANLGENDLWIELV